MAVSSFHFLDPIPLAIRARLALELRLGHHVMDGGLSNHGRDRTKDGEDMEDLAGDSACGVLTH